MRLQYTSNDQLAQVERFAQWILDVKDGKIGEPHDGFGSVEIPYDYLIMEFPDPIMTIVTATYPNLASNWFASSFFTTRAILTPIIEVVNKVNSYICSIFPGASVDYYSSDSVCINGQDSDCFDTLYTTKFLNAIECSRLPLHKLSLKVWMPIMLIRNIDQSLGLCSGTRFVIKHLGLHILQAETLNGSNPGELVFIHRMDMNLSDSRWPFRLQRRQCPIIVSFAMTINKS